jgi:hypothetical protein
MQRDGGYVRWVKLDKKKPGTLGPVSTEITGYAAHLYAWLFSVMRSDDLRRAGSAAGDYLVACWNRDGRLYCEPEAEEKLLFFFDNGIAARGLYSAGRALNRTDFWDVSCCIAAQMRCFKTGFGIYDPILAADFSTQTDPKEWWSTRPGAYQKKAALVWRLVGSAGEIYDLDAAWWFAEPQPAPGPPPKNGDAAEVAAYQQAVHVLADSLHPWAYHCEALWMTERSSGDRFAKAFAELERRFDYGKVHRADVLAQLLRLHILQGDRGTPVSMVADLLELQHESGGFHFKRTGGKLSDDLSVHATIFAAQALALVLYPEAAKFPGPLKQRDMMIV